MTSPRAPSGDPDAFEGTERFEILDGAVEPVHERERRTEDADSRAFALRGCERVAEALCGHGLRACFFDEPRDVGASRMMGDDASFELLAPRHFSVVVFRYHPAGHGEAELDTLNARILDAVNASGEIFLSHTKAKGRYAIRVAIGNLRTESTHVARAWQLIREHAHTLLAGITS